MFKLVMNKKFLNKIAKIELLQSLHNFKLVI